MRLSETIKYAQHRFLQDALTMATAAYWRKRAEDFEAARPRPGDYNGNATPEQLKARDERMAGIARACRNHAALLGAGQPSRISDEVAAVLREVA